ncbi:hypothetical protein D3C85_1092610 [compost metagenome]
MLLPDTPIWPAPWPWSRTLSTSSPATPLATIATVTLPPLKSAESASLRVALLPASISTAVPPSLKPTESPLRLPTTGTALLRVVKFSVVLFLMPLKIAPSRSAKVLLSKRMA